MTAWWSGAWPGPGGEGHVGAVTAWWSGAWPGPGGEGVPALGGGPAVVTVVTSVVHAGANVHSEASFGLLFDLGDRPLGPIPVPGHGGGGRLPAVPARLGLKRSHGLGNSGSESELLP